MPVTYHNLMQDYDAGQNNMGGIQQIGWYGSIPDFETISTPAANPTDALDEFVIAQPHVMKEGKQMFKIYTEVNKGSITYERLGSEDGGGFRVTANMFIPGDSKKQTFLANKVMSSKYIALIPDADGLMNQIGTEGFPASIKLSKETATNDGVKGYNAEVTAYMPWKLIYAAGVPNTPAT